MATKRWQKPSPRQLDVLKYVTEQMEGPRPLCPTRQEIATRFGWSSIRSVVDHLRALERKGFIELPPGTQRAIYITEAGKAAIASGDVSISAHPLVRGHVR
jgi:SOS-response transcriptional repressor LexA